MEYYAVYHSSFEGMGYEPVPCFEWEKIKTDAALADWVSQGNSGFIFKASMIHAFYQTLCKLYTNEETVKYLEEEACIKKLRAAGYTINYPISKMQFGTYVGDLIIKKLEPETYTPTDIIRILEEIQIKCRAADLAAGCSEEDAGVFDLIIGDTADQIRPDRGYKDAWYEVGKTHQKLCTIPERFNCPWIATVQGGQQTVGAAQITERDIGEGYGKGKPYKLILGVAQTPAQYHGDQTVNIADTFVQANLANMTNYSYPADKDTVWKPMSLCLVKNTRAVSRKGHAANKVKIPLLVSYGTQRLIVDYTQAETPLATSMQTHREDLIVKEAQKAPPVRRGKVEKI